MNLFLNRLIAGNFCRFILVFIPFFSCISKGDNLPVQISGAMHYNMYDDNDRPDPSRHMDSTFSAIVSNQFYRISIEMADGRRGVAIFNGNNTQISWSSPEDDSTNPLVHIYNGSFANGIGGNYEYDAIYFLIASLGYINMDDFTNSIVYASFLRANSKFHPKSLSVRSKSGTNSIEEISIYQNPFNYVGGKLVPWATLKYGYLLIRARWENQQNIFKYGIYMPTNIPANEEDVSMFESVVIDKLQILQRK